MAAQAKQRPGRSLALVALVLVALYLGVFLGPASTPALGLDLRGGTEVTLTAHPIAGSSKVDKSALNQAVNIIRQRASGIGANGASVTTQGNDTIVVAVPGKAHDQVVNTIGQTALLRFRQALSIAAPVPAPVTTTSPSPTASSKATAKPHAKGSKATATPKATKSAKSSGLALSSVLEKASATKSPSPSATPTSSPSVAAVTVGSASPTATSSASPSATPTTTASAPAGSTSKPLPGSQSLTLTQAFATSFENWNCLKQPNPTQGADDPDFYIIACDKGGSAKYLLAPAAVEGTQVSSASANIDATSKWIVQLNFNGSGATAWQKVTETAYNANNGQPSTSCSPPKGCNAVAIVLDGVVVSAPYISSAGGIPGGKAEISGTFTQSEANQLANVLKYGALPLKFTADDVRSVSATLGSTQLRGGLIAGGIGLILVIIFSLVYYRALGLVTVGSLLVSGLILYAAVTLLGASAIHYTLSLPGIAGFIVSIGITADSFVVFFERIRDEIREGRRMRSAVDRAWPRARRTILSADTVSLLAAVVLYVVSIGDVRGFAFTLGLSTVSDLFIVFFFTRPVLQLLGRVKAFDSGASWTGIGRARVGVSRDEDAEPQRRTPVSRTPRPKEA